MENKKAITPTNLGDQERAQFNIRIPAYIKLNLDIRAKQEDKSVNTYIIDILKKHLEICSSCGQKQPELR